MASNPYHTEWQFDTSHPTIQGEALVWLEVNGYYANMLEGANKNSPLWVEMKRMYREKFGRDMSADMEKYLGG